MNKSDLIRLRNEQTDPDVKAKLRWAINRIEALENQLAEVRSLVRALSRASE
jgi:hypothetical protein